MAASNLSLFSPDPDDTECPLGVGPHSTLRQCYTVLILPNLESREGTLELNDDALMWWERYTDDPSAEAIDSAVMKSFRTKLVEQPFKRGNKKLKRSPATVNRHLRHIEAIISPLWPADRHNSGGHGFIPFFKKVKRVALQKKLPFTFSREELSSLYIHADACKPRPNKYNHRRCHMHNPALWRCALALEVNTGPRTWDLFGLRWEDFRPNDFRHGSVYYESLKSSKFQRPPLNSVSRTHLDFVKSLNLDPVFVFPGFYKGHTFYETWDRIRKAAGVIAPFESLRKTCSTMHNNVVPKAGAWLTGHELQGVNAQSYDDPTNRVLKAVYKLKLPDEFKRAAEELLARMSS